MPGNYSLPKTIDTRVARNLKTPTGSIDLHSTDVFDFHDQNFAGKGVFSNFSAHIIEVDGIRYPTSEHYFQAMAFIPLTSDAAATKTSKELVVKSILESGDPQDAYNSAETNANLKDKSNRDDYMSIALDAKLQQHQGVALELLATGNKLMVETAHYDDYYGTGSKGTGNNVLGKLWQEKRENLMSVIANQWNPQLSIPDMAKKFADMHPKEIENEIQKNTGKSIQNILDHDVYTSKITTPHFSPDITLGIKNLRADIKNKNVIPATPKATRHSRPQMYHSYYKELQESYTAEISAREKEGKEYTTHFPSPPMDLKDKFINFWKEASPKIPIPFVGASVSIPSHATLAVLSGVVGVLSLGFGPVGLIAAAGFSAVAGAVQGAKSASANGLSPARIAASAVLGFATGALIGGVPFFGPIVTVSLVKVVEGAMKLTVPNIKKLWNKVSNNKPQKPEGVSVSGIGNDIENPVVSKNGVSVSSIENPAVSNITQNNYPLAQKLSPAAHSSATKSVDASHASSSSSSVSPTNTPVDMSGAKKRKLNKR